MRVLVVDDEPLARERLRGLLAGHADVTVVGERGDGLSALEALRELEPDLLLLDLQMPGLGGLEVLDARRREGPLPLVVCVTAFDRYALEAFQRHALDYLLKPIDSARFDDALSRARALLAGRGRAELERRLAELLDAHERQRARAPHLVVRDGERYRLVRFADIECIEGAGNYASVHTAATTLLLRETLASLEGRLDPARFLRTHRSWIVALEHVAEARAAAKGAWVLRTRSGREVPLSAQHREALGRILG